LTEYELTSSEKINTPQVIKWLVQNYKLAKAEAKPILIRTLSEGYNLKPETAKKLLEGEIIFSVKGENVTFKVKEDDNV